MLVKDGYKGSGDYGFALEHTMVKHPIRTEGIEIYT
jgi:hypothetical protein